MNNSKTIIELAKQNNGVITTAMVVAAGCSRGSLKYLADNGTLEKSSRGVYRIMFCDENDAWCPTRRTGHNESI